MTLTENMKQALRIAANSMDGNLTSSRSPDWRHGNEVAVRTAYALEKRGLIERRWSDTKFGSACYRITSEGRATADVMDADEPGEA